MKKFNVIFATVGGKDVHLTLDDIQLNKLMKTEKDSWFYIDISSKQKYVINMRNVVSIYITEES